MPIPVGRRPVAGPGVTEGLALGLEGFGTPAGATAGAAAGTAAGAAEGSAAGADDGSARGDALGRDAVPAGRTTTGLESTRGSGGGADVARALVLGVGSATTVVGGTTSLVGGVVSIVVAGVVGGVVSGVVAGVVAGVVPGVVPGVVSGVVPGVVVGVVSGTDDAGGAAARAMLGIDTAAATGVTITRPRIRPRVRQLNRTERERAPRQRRSREPAEHVT